MSQIISLKKMLPTLPAALSDQSHPAPTSTPSTIKIVLLQAAEDVCRSEQQIVLIDTCLSGSSTPETAPPRPATSRLPPLPQGDRSRSNSSISEEPPLDSPASLSLRRTQFKAFQSSFALLDDFSQSLSSPSSRKESFNVPLHRLGVFEHALKGHRPQSPSDSPFHDLSMRNLLKTSLSRKHSASSAVDDAESVATGIVPPANSLDQSIGNSDMGLDVPRYLPQSQTLVNHGSSSFSSSLTDEEQQASSKASIENDVVSDISLCSVGSIFTESITE